MDVLLNMIIDNMKSYNFETFSNNQQLQDKWLKKSLTTDYSVQRAHSGRTTTLSCRPHCGKQCKKKNMVPFQNQSKSSFIRIETHLGNLCTVYIPPPPANNDIHVCQSVKTAMVTEREITPASHLNPHLMFAGVFVYIILNYAFIILNTTCYLHLLCQK